MIRGAPAFDGIALGELQANFIGTNLQLEGKAAFVNSGTGNTHGWTSNKTWSPAVIQKLKELKELIELDFARIHFEQNGVAAIYAGSAVPAPPMREGGIGESINEKVPSI